MKTSLKSQNVAYWHNGPTHTMMNLNERDDPPNVYRHKREYTMTQTLIHFDFAFDYTSASKSSTYTEHTKTRAHTHGSFKIVEPLKSIFLSFCSKPPFGHVYLVLLSPTQFHSTLQGTCPPGQGNRLS